MLQLVMTDLIVEKENGAAIRQGFTAVVVGGGVNFGY